jgi:hypothetical protein
MSCRSLPAKLFYTSKKTAKDIPQHFREFTRYNGRNWGAKIDQECTRFESP